MPVGANATIFPQCFTSQRRFERDDQILLPLYRDIHPVHLGVVARGRPGTGFQESVL
ncbi:hypothetical protein M413DRAFT_440652 [Hebeloma cylindrosporum]|uniref:Uncharacterized protein n=1 Tax=Hebeloma cylindrosporum TaxID=76867 RepID=A0A0C3CTE9_HEBCY|nr:hypothetical protein M413DRAFT_440652 [Hebeloma cylindrosporum h7]